MATPEIIDQVVDHPAGDVHVVSSATADTEYDASTLPDQQEDIKAYLKDKVAIKKDVEGSFDVAHEVLKESNDHLESRGGDMSHEVAVNAGAVNGTELNGAHTTEETLALVTPVEVEERSGLAAVEANENDFLPAGETEADFPGAREAAPVGAVNSVTDAKDEADSSEATNLVMSAEIVAEALGPSSPKAEASALSVTRDAGEATLRAGDLFVVEKKGGDESSQVTLDGGANENEAVSAQEEVPVPSAGAPVDEPEVSTHKVEVVTTELVHAASEDKEKIIVEETEANVQETSPANPVLSANGESTDDVASAKEETALETPVPEEVERNETAAVVEEVENHPATSEASQPIETHAALPGESSVVEQGSPQIEVPVSTSLVESTGLADEALVPTEPDGVKELVESEVSVSVGEAEPSINGATPSLVEEHASPLEPVVADPTQDLAEPTTVKASSEAEAPGIVVMGVIKDAGSPAEEGNTPAKSSASDEAGTPSVAGAELDHLPDSSDPVDEIITVKDAESQKSSGNEEFVGDGIELKATAPEPDVPAEVAAEAPVKVEDKTSLPEKNVTEVTQSSTEPTVKAEELAVGEATVQSEAIELGVVDNTPEAPAETSVARDEDAAEEVTEDTIVDAAVDVPVAVESQHEVFNLAENSAQMTESSVASSATVEEPSQIALEAPAQIGRTEPESEVDNHIASSAEEVEGVLHERPVSGTPAQSAVEGAPALAEPQATDLGAPTPLIHEDSAAEPTEEVGSAEPTSVEGAVHPTPMDASVPLAASEVHANNDSIGSGIASSDPDENHNVLPPVAEEIPITVEPPTPHITTTTTEEGESSMEAAPVVDDVLTEIGIANKQGLNETETESEVSEPHEVTDVVEDTPGQDSIITGTVTEEEHATEEENIHLSAGKAAGDDLAVNDAIASAEGAGLIEETQDEGEGHGINGVTETTLAEAEGVKPEPVVPESNLAKVVVVEENSSLAANEAPEISSGDDLSLNPLQSSEGPEDAIVTESDSVPADTPLAIESEAEEPKAPWTPSFQVVAVGGSLLASSVQPESEDTTAAVPETIVSDKGVELNTPSDVPVTAEPERPIHIGEPNLVPPTVLLDTSLLEILEEPPTSYSVHSVGSPLGHGIDLKEDQPAERPWTPSYSVHSQGSPRPEDLPDQRPWTPSYSVHSQGSPLLTPTHVAEDDATSVEKMDIQEKEVAVPEVNSEAMPKNEKLTSTVESVAPAQIEGHPLELEADAGEFVAEEQLAHSVVQPVADEVSRLEEIAQASTTQESVPDLVPNIEEVTQFSTGVAAEPSLDLSPHSEDGRKSPSWVPSHSISVPPSLSREHPEPLEGSPSGVGPELAQASEGSIDVIQPSIPSASDLDCTEVGQDLTVAERVVAIGEVTPKAEISAEVPQSSAESIPSDGPAVSDLAIPSPDEGPHTEANGVAELGRPKSPWTPSYSVTMQGPSTDAEELDNLEPLPQRSIVPEISEDSNTQDETSTVNEVKEQTSAEFIIPTIAVEEPRVSLEAPLERNTETIPEDTAVTDLHEVFPSTEDTVESSLPKLNIHSIIETQNDALGSTMFTRKRLESTTSSRFFPGGWFSPRSEGRTSLEIAQGEFTPVKTTHHPDDVPDSVSELDDNEAEAEELESVPQEKSRWCVVM